MASAHSLLVCRVLRALTLSFSWCYLDFAVAYNNFVAMLLQLYAKQKNDAKLMVEIMKLLKKNDLPLQPGTADIVFRYINL